MKKQCNRILAMLLTLVTLLTVLPISAFAAPWVEAEGETTKNENVTTSNITVTLDAQALLGYLKDRDIKGLVSGLSINGLRDIISAEELFEIIPESDFRAIIESISEDIDPEKLMGLIDLDALMKEIDQEALIDLVLGLPDLEDYIKDYDLLMSYVDNDQFANAVPYVDVEALANDYSDVLLDLVLELDGDVLFTLIDIDAAIELDNVQLFDLVDLDYLAEKLGGYGVLYNNYTNKAAIDAFVKNNFMLWADLDGDGFVDASFFDAYIDPTNAGAMIEDPDFDKSMIDRQKLKDYVLELYNNGDLTYNDLKPAVDITKLLEEMQDPDSAFRQNPDIREAVKNALAADPAIRADIEALFLAELNSGTYDYSMFESYVTNEAGAETELRDQFAAEYAADPTFFDAYLVDNGSGIAAFDLAGFFADHSTKIDFDAFLGAAGVDRTAVVNDLMASPEFDAQIDQIMQNDPDAFTAMLDRGILDQVLQTAIFDGASSLSIEELAHHYIHFGALINVPYFAPTELDHREILIYANADTAELMKFDMIRVPLLIENGVIDIHGILSWIYTDSIIDKLQELAASSDPAERIEYSLLLDFNALKQHIVDLLALGAPNGLTTEQVLGCIVKNDEGQSDYAKVINAIDGKGKRVIDAVRAAYGLTYSEIIDTYIFPGKFPNLINALGAKDIANEIIADGKLTQVFDLPGLIKVIGVRTLLDYVDLKDAITRLWNDGSLITVAKTAIKDLTPDKYIACLNQILNSLHNNVREIKINGVVITERKNMLLSFNIEKILQAFQTAFPTLEELAEIKDNIVLDDFSFSITYKADGTDTVKTKEINAVVKLNGGADKIRALATKLKSLINKYVTYSYDNNDIKLEITLPSKFATAVKKVLEGLGASADPELITLRDELLALYDANLSDTANFVNNVTVSQLVTLLNSVDPTVFTTAYNKIMKQQYVELLLEYIEKITKVDLSDVEINAVLDRVADISVPTVEQIAGKVEDITGRDLVSKLPARVNGVLDSVAGKEITEIFDALAAKAGLDVDTKEILLAAAASSDPLAYLYNTFVDLLENNEAAYNAIKERVMRVMNRLLASSIGSRLDTYRLADLYNGNGSFTLSLGATVDPKAYLEKLADKIIDLVLDRVSVDPALIENVKDILFGMISDSEFTFNVEANILAKDLYRATFYDDDMNIIGTYFLPAGTDLAVLMENKYTPADPTLFLGWEDDTNTIYNKMPAKDVALFPSNADGKSHVYIYHPDDLTTPIYRVDLLPGETLSAEDIAKLESLVDNKLYDDDTVTWYVVENGVNIGAEWDLENDAVGGDMGLTWAVTHRTYTVTIVYPNSLNPVAGGSFTVTRGDNLEQFAEAMGALVPAGGNPYTWHLVEGGVVSDSEYALDTEVHSDLTLTWKIVLDTYTVTVVDPVTGDTAGTFEVEYGANLESVKLEMLALTPAADKGLTPAWYVVDTTVDAITTANYYTLTTAVTSDLTLTWKFYQITLYDYLNDSTTVLELGDGDKLTVEAMKATAGITGNPAWFELDTLRAPTQTDTKTTAFDFVVTWDMTFTWKFYKVTVYDYTADTYDELFLDNGELLTLDALKAAAGITGNPAWYQIDTLRAPVKEDTKIAAFDFAPAWDMTLTFKFYEITVIDPNTGRELETYQLNDGDGLISIYDDMLALTDSAAKGIVPAWYVLDADGKYTKEDKYSNFTSAVDWDYDLTWKYYQIKVYNYNTDAQVGTTLELGDNKTLASIATELLALTDAATKGLTPAWHLYVDGGIGELYSEKFDDTVLWDIDLTWHYPVVTIEVWGSTGTDSYKHYTDIPGDGNTREVGYLSTFGALLSEIASKYEGYEDYLLTDSATAYLGAIYKSFHNEWKDSSDVALVASGTISGDITIRLYIMPDEEKPGISMSTDTDAFGFAFDATANNILVTFTNDNWDASMSLLFNVESLETCVEQGYGISLSSGSGNQKVYLNAAMAKVLYNKLKAENATNATLNYAEVTDVIGGLTHGEWTPNEGSGAKGYTFRFAFDGNDIDGNFFGDNTVEITLSFAGKGIEAASDEKTFLYVDGILSNDWLTASGATSVTLKAQHFSEFMLVNKYRLSYLDAVWSDTMDDSLVLKTLTTILKNELIESGYYANEETFTKNAFEFLDQYAIGLTYEGTKILKTDNTSVGMLNDAFTKMPAYAIRLQHVVSTPVYNIFYYTTSNSGVYSAADRQLYTRFDYTPLSWATVCGFRADLLNGGAWTGITEDGWNQCLNGSPKNVYLFRTAEGEPDPVITITFKWDDADGTTFTLSHTLAEWLSTGLGALNADILNNLETLGLTVEEYELITWKFGEFELSKISVEKWIEILTGTTPVVFEANRSEMSFTVNADGNVDDVVNSARPGDTVTFTVIEKLGMTSAVVILADGVEVPFELVNGTYSFTMPAKDVTIVVSYAIKTFQYVDVNGVLHTDIAYGSKIEYELIVPDAHWVDAAALTATLAEFGPAGITLVSSTRNADGNMVLTYAFSLTEDGINLQAFDALARQHVNKLIYQTVYVVDGKYYYTEKDALAACPEGVTVTWERGIYQNMFIASFEKAEDDTLTSLIWLIVLLLIIILILIIAILYTLYICGKLKPNWFLKLITAIVSGFFAICMAVAAAGLAIARFFGNEEKDMMDDESDAGRTPDEVELIPDVSEAEEEAPAEESAPADEAADEAEAADPTMAAVAEDAIEVTVEDVVEETLEEVVAEAEAEADMASEVEEPVAEEVEIEEVETESASEAEAETAEEPAPETVEEAVEEAEPVEVEESVDEAETAPVEESEEAASEEDETRKNETNE